MIWQAFLHSLNCVAILILLGGAGYWTAQLGWYDERSKMLISKLVTFLSLPAYLFSSVMSHLTHEELIDLFPQLLIPFATIWTGFAISRVIAHFGHINVVHKGVFSSAFTASNNMFIGVPVSLALFGEKAIIPTLLYFFINTSFFWTVGNFLEARDGQIANHQPAQPILSWTSIRRVFSPPFCGFLLAIACIVINVEPPSFIMASAHYLGNMTSALALIFIGLMLFSIGIRNISFTRDLAWVFFGRFLLLPLLCLGFAHLFPTTEMFAKVFVIQAALPCISQIAILAKYHHADARFATTCVASTTLGCLVALPIWMIVLTSVI